MGSEWQELTRLTGGRPIVVERVRLTDADVAIEGAFELPPLSRLAAEDQVFVVAFVRRHGSIKQMERLFGISYPTVKNRLNRIAGELGFVETDVGDPEPPPRSGVLDALDRGEISVDEAIERLES